MKSITIPIEVSARHVHLTEDHIKRLFGHSLTELKPISQTGQFAANETVAIESKPPLTLPLRKGETKKLQATNYKLQGVRVVGPARSESQVELALSDCRMLGLKNVPLKVSGSLAGTPGITLVGPKGNVVLKRGVIVTQRHIHCPTRKAKLLGLKNGQVVTVRVGGKRGVIFENVIVRIREDFVWRMHIDTDEANATGIEHGAVGVMSM